MRSSPLFVAIPPYEELSEITTAEPGVRLHQAQVGCEELLADVEWEPVPAKVMSLRGMRAAVVIRQIASGHAHINDPCADQPHDRPGKS